MVIRLILFRYKNYNHKQCVRHDPYWQTHLGWFILGIRKEFSIFSELRQLLETYPEYRNGNIEIFHGNLNDVDFYIPTDKMDSYVCGRTDIIPEPQKLSYEEIWKNSRPVWVEDRDWVTDEVTQEYLWYPNRYIGYIKRKENQ